MSSVIKPIDLRRTAGAVAANYGDKGAVIITLGDDGFRVGVSNLTSRELQDALCVAIHHNFLEMDDDDG